MSSGYTITVSPEAQELMKRLGDKSGLNLAIMGAMDSQNKLTVGHIQKTYLSGQGAKPHPPSDHILRTGKSPRLRTSILWGNSSIEDGNVVGRIYSELDVKYAAVHEYGFRDFVRVREHMRTTSSALLKSGKEISIRAAIKQGLTTTKGGVKKSAGLLSKAFHTVKSHDRLMNIPARAPVQTGIRDRLPEYKTAIGATIASYMTSGRNA